MSDFLLEKNFFCELLEKLLYDESVWPVLATCSRQKLNAFFVCDSLNSLKPYAAKAASIEGNNNIPHNVIIESAYLTI